MIVHFRNASAFGDEILSCLLPLVAAGFIGKYAQRNLRTRQQYARELRGPDERHGHQPYRSYPTPSVWKGESRARNKFVIGHRISKGQAALNRGLPADAHKWIDVTYRSNRSETVSATPKAVEDLKRRHDHHPAGRGGIGKSE